MQKILDLIKLLPVDKRGPYLLQLKALFDHKKQSKNIETQIAMLLSSTNEMSEAMIKDVESGLLEVTLDNSKRVNQVEKKLSGNVGEVEKRLDAAFGKLRQELSTIKDEKTKTDAELRSAIETKGLEIDEKLSTTAHRLDTDIKYVDNKLSGEIASVGAEVRTKLGKGDLPKKVTVVAGENVRVRKIETKSSTQYKISSEGGGDVTVMGGAASTNAKRIWSGDIDQPAAGDDNSALTYNATTNTYDWTPITGASLADTDALSEGVSNFYYNPERFVGTGGASVAVNGVTITIYSAAGGAGGTIENTNELPEGTSNFYYTEARFDTSLGTKTSNDLVEGASALYYSSVRFDASLSGKDTNDLDEGTTNWYYNPTRLVAGNGISVYRNGATASIGVVDLEIDHDALTNTHDLTTDIDHNSITNTHNLTTDIDHASITNTHNLTTDINSGSITEGASGLFYSSVRFDSSLATKNTNDLTEGTTSWYYNPVTFVGSNGTSVYSTGKTVTIYSSGDAAGEANTASNLGVSGVGFYDSKDGVDLRFKQLSAITQDLKVTAGISGTVNIGTTNLLNNYSTNDLSEGISGLYYSSVKFDASLATKSTNNLTEGNSGLYYSSVRFDSSLATKNTNDITEGTTNWYYKPERIVASTGVSIIRNGATIEIQSGLGASYEFDYIDLNTSASSTSRIGRIRWNNTDKAVEYDSHINGTIVSNQIGQETWVRVRNNTGVTIGNGSALYISGSLGNRPTVALANATSESTSLSYMGLATENLLNNEDGFLTTIGSVRGIDTSAWTPGEVLYVSGSTPGLLTTSRPIAPAQVIEVGVVSVSNPSTGVISVHPRVYPNIERVSNVHIAGVTNYDILRYDSVNERWGNTSLITNNVIEGTTNWYYNPTRFVGVDGVSVYSTGLTTSIRGANKASEISVLSVGASVEWDNAQEVFNLINSAGRASGGEVTDAGSETVNVAAGNGFIKATDSDTVDLLSFSWAESLAIAIPTDTTRYIGVIYNSGDPEVDIRVSDNYDLDTEFILATVVNEAGTLHILNSPWWVTDGITNIIERFNAEKFFTRDDAAGGLMLSVSGTRNVNVSPGILWNKLNEFPVTTVATGASGTVEAYWRNASGVWNDSGITQYPVLQYNDITGASLVNLNNNYYANFWVYAEADDQEVSLVYPQNQYSNSASAEAAAPPTVIPPHIQENGKLIGRILFKQAVDAPISVQSAFTTVFSASQAADHGNLSGLGDDDHIQYHNDVRGSSWLSTKTTNNLTQGTSNFYHKAANFVASTGVSVIRNGVTVSIQANGVSVAHDTNAVAEGTSNFYYTEARFNSSLGTKSTNNLIEGNSGLYYSSVRFDASLATKSTNNLTEGNSGLYYSAPRFDASLATKNTNNLTEGTTNWYYKPTRLVADSGISIYRNGVTAKIGVVDLDIDHNSLTNTHDLTTDIDHNSITNTHNLTTDIDHDSITNTHNLTTDINSGSITEGASGLFYSSTRFDASLATKNTNNLTEGTTNWYYNPTRLVGSGGASVIINGLTATIHAVTGAGGTIENTNELPEGTTNWYYKPNRLTGLNGISVTSSGVTTTIRGNTNWDAAYTHITSDGSDHSFINQAVTSTANPTFASVSATGAISAGGDINASTNSSTLANPRVFGYKDLTAGEACRFQFGDEHNGFQNAYGNDVQIYSYWGLQLMGGMQNYSTGFIPPAYSVTADVGVLVTAPALDTVVPFAVRGCTSQTKDLTQWRTISNGVVASVAIDGTFTGINGLTEGASTLYYSAPKFDASLATKSTNNLTEGTTNWYYKPTRLVGSGGASVIVNGLTATIYAAAGGAGGTIENTNQLPEGTTNWYYTQSRFDTSLGTKTTNNLAEGSSGLYYSQQRFDSAVQADDLDLFGINMVLGSGATVISGGVKGYVEMPFNGTITSVRLLAGITGTLTVDIWNDTYANYPPLVADTITGSSPMKLVNAMKSEETGLGGWQTGVTAGDVLAINVAGCTTITSATLSIRGTKG